VKNRTKTQLTTNKTKICESEACKNSGKYLLSSINQTIDPCDDFYQFSCGGWISNHQIKKDKPKINNMMILDEKLQEDIKKQLNKEVDASDSKSVAFAKQFFKSCLDEETLEIRGFEPLFNALNSIGGWPIVNNTNYIEDNYSWQNALAKVAGVFNLNPILGININQDTRHSTTHIIYVSIWKFS
jgi:predicted metalloendopeptidase